MLERILKVKEDVRELTKSLWKLMRLLVVLCVVIIVLVAGINWQVQRRNSRLDDLDKTQRQVATSVEEIRQVANDISDQSPEEVQRQAAIGRAVEAIPEIKTILCRQFPSPECNQ
jgi:hypothetical protein